MPNQNQPLGKGRRQEEPLPGGATEDLGRSDSPSSPRGSPTSHEKAIFFLSDLLATKKEVLARSPRSREAPLVDLKGAVDQFAPPLTHSETTGLKSEVPTILLEPRQVAFADASGKESIPNTEAEFDPASPPATGSSREASEIPRNELAGRSREASSLADGTMGSTDREFAGNAVNPHVGPVSASRLSLSITHSLEHTRSTDSVRNKPPATAEVLARDDARFPSELTGTESVSNSADLIGRLPVPENWTVDRLRNGGESMIPENPQLDGESNAEESSPTAQEVERPRAFHSLDPSSSTVRNPLSDELRNFAMANPALKEDGREGSGLGDPEVNQREASIGTSSTALEGDSMDLSRTNELLQQLVDAVRNPRNSSLPIGGPVVYPDR